MICFLFLMWAHYANNHKGFLLTYLKDDVRLCKSYSITGEEISKKLALKSVDYVNKQVDMTEYIHDFMLKNVLPSNLDTSKIADIPVSKLREMAITKSTEWKYEKEWRLLPRIIKIDEESSFGYISIVPRAIIAGLECSEENQKILYAISRQKKIPYYKMKRKIGNEYEIEIA